MVYLSDKARANFKILRTIEMVANTIQYDTEEALRAGDESIDPMVVIDLANRYSQSIKKLALASTLYVCSHEFEPTKCYEEFDIMWCKICASLVKIPCPHNFKIMYPVES